MKLPRRGRVGLLGLALLTSALPAVADDAAELAALKAQLAALQQRIEKLEKQNAPHAGAQEPTDDQLLHPDVPTKGTDVDAGVTPGSRSLNPDLAVVGEIVGSAFDRSRYSPPFRHGFFQRSLEIAASQRVSPAARAVTKLTYGGPTASGADGGLDLEEAYLQFDQLVKKIQLRCGRERVPFLAYSLADGHEMPFIQRPLSIARLVGDEALKEDGARVSFLLPTPFYANLDAGLYTGRNETLFNGKGTGGPAYFTRLNGAHDWADGRHELTWQASYLRGPRDDGGHRTAQLVGAETQWQLLESQFDRWQVRGSYIRAQVQGVNGARDGWNLHLARRWDRYALHQVGYLYDRSTGLDLTALPVTTHTLTYGRALTERIRPEIDLVHSSERGRPDDNTLYVRLSYAAGTHPAHD